MPEPAQKNYNLFQAYGIKEVADVTFYDTATGYPVLYLDTLKVSSIEETAEQSEARGGKGNAPLIIWDYGKDITLTLEDALFSMKSMATIFGGRISEEGEIVRAKKFTGDGTSEKPNFIPSASKEAAKVFKDVGGEEYKGTFEKGVEYIANWTEKIDAQKITINAESFPGTYKIIGDTYARNRNTGKDEFFQFVIPMAKMNSENTISMQAEGDPSTFSMTLKVLRPENGDMMELIKYPKTASQIEDEGLIIDMGEGGPNFVPKATETKGPDDSGHSVP